MNLLTDFRFALRSLARVKGLALTVVVTLALGIGANAAIFSVVRGVLLKPLANRDEDRLIYIRQSARGHRVRQRQVLGPGTARFPRADQDAVGVRRFLDDRLHARRPRRAARRARRRGRRIVLRRDGPAAGARPPDRRPRRRSGGGGRGGADAPVLDDLAGQRSGGARQDDPPERSLRDDHRRRRTVGALSGTNRDHRQPRHQPASHVGDDGRGTRAPDDGSLRASRAGRGARCGARRAARRAHLHHQRAPRGLSGQGRLQDRRGQIARSDHLAGADRAARPAGGVGADLRDRVLQRRQPDPGALGPPRGRAVDPRRARRRHRRAAANAARREPVAVRRGRDARRAHRESHGRGAGALRLALLGARAGSHRRFDAAVGRRRPGDRVGRAAGVRAAAAVGRRIERARPVERQRADHLGHESPPAGVRGHANRRVVRPARRRQHADHDAGRAAAHQARHEHA